MPTYGMLPSEYDRRLMIARTKTSAVETMADRLLRRKKIASHRVKAAIDGDRGRGAAPRA